MQIAELIRAYRQSQGISLREFARRTRLSPATVSTLENGNRGLGVKAISHLAPVLGLGYEELMRIAEEPPADLAG